MPLERFNSAFSIFERNYYSDSFKTWRIGEGFFLLLNDLKFSICLAQKMQSLIQAPALQAATERRVIPKPPKTPERTRKLSELQKSTARKPLLRQMEKMNPIPKKPPPLLLRTQIYRTAPGTAQRSRSPMPASPQETRINRVTTPQETERMRKR